MVEHSEETRREWRWLECVPRWGRCCTRANTALLYMNSCVRKARVLKIRRGEIRRHNVDGGLRLTRNDNG